MKSLRILRPNGDSLHVEIDEAKTVIDVKQAVEAEVGLPVSEQKLVLDTRVLEDKIILSEIRELGSHESSVTLVHEISPPWCWPCCEVQSDPVGVHKLTLFEDPEVTEEEVLYQDDWDEEFDQKIMERWRKRGLRCIPGVGSRAGHEFKFEYMENRCLKSSDKGSECRFHYLERVLGDNKDGVDAFVNRCLKVALECPSDHVWPEDALRYSALIEWSPPKNPIFVSARLLDDTNHISLQVSELASFADLYNDLAVTLLRAGHYFPSGFELWSADGCAPLPTGNLKFLQPALRGDDGQSFSCVVVSRSQIAVAIAGEGLFPISSVPEKEECTARVGLIISHGASQRIGPGMLAMKSLTSRSHGHEGRCKQECAALSTLDANIAEADDLERLTETGPGCVVQLFKISKAGILYTTVRETGDGNMVGGSYYTSALPAEASSSVVRSLLAAIHFQKGWARLANGRDCHRSIRFLSLQEHETVDPGLCICRASHDER